MNPHRAFFLLAGLSCAAGSAGCRGTTPSDVVATDDILADITVYDDGYGSVNVGADLSVRANDSYLRLAKGDSLRATFGSQSSVMSDQGAGDYATSFALSNAGQVTVALDRTKYADAVQSVGALPEALDIAGYEGAIISRSNDSILLDLPETVGEKAVDIDGPCISGSHDDVGTGAVTLHIYSSYYSVDDGSECEVTLTITTSLYGTPDPALHPESTFVLRRARHSSFYSVP